MLTLIWSDDPPRPDVLDPGNQQCRPGCPHYATSYRPHSHWRQDRPPARDRSGLLARITAWFRAQDSACKR